MTIQDSTNAQLQYAKTLDVFRYLSAKDEALRTAGDLAKIYRERWPNSVSCALVEAEQRKAIIPGATPTGWGSPLIPTAIGSVLAAYVQPFTVLGRILGALRAPFNTRFIRSLVPMQFAWTGAGQPAPATSGQLAGTTLPMLKASGIMVQSDELVRLEAPGSELLWRDEMRDGVVAFLDDAFVDPMAAGVADTSPASITYGVTPLSSSGVTEAAALSDFARLLQVYENNGGKIESVVVLMPSTIAVALALTGAGQFRNLGRDGGQIAGIPVIASAALRASGSPGGGHMVIALDASKLMVADDLGIDIAMSRRGTLQMIDNPTNSVATGTATNQISLFETNSVALKVDRFVNWSVGAGGVTYMDDVSWLSVGSPS